jgi:hypothetical protein
VRDGEQLEEFETREELLAKFRLTFYEERPILVLGPGTRRVGWDDEREPGWRVTRRRFKLLFQHLGRGARRTEDDTQVTTQERKAEEAFLNGYWWMKLSEERHRRESAHKQRLEFNRDGEAAEDHWPDDALAEVLLPLRLAAFDALRAATVLFGRSVATGDRPLTGLTQQAILVPTDTRLTRSLRAAAAIAEAIALSSGNGTNIDRTLAKLEHDAWWYLHGTDDSAERGSMAERWVERWSAGPARTALRSASGTQFSPAARHLSKLVDIIESGNAVSGAVVEWLSDLFWHVMTADAAIPPSQSDLAFAINLAASTDADEAFFSRARPGDHRTAATKQRTDGAHRSIKALIGRYPTYASSQSPRHDFHRVLASTLLHAGPGRADRQPIAIVTDYDRGLEEALVDVADPGQGFHIVLPVLVAGSLRWVIGKRLVSLPDGEQQGEADRGWRWIDPRATSTSDIPLGSNEPVIIRLSGSPLQTIRDRMGRETEFRGTVQELGIAGTSSVVEPGDRVHPATMFSELEVLEAMTSFLQLSGTGSQRFGWNLIAGPRGLIWHGRPWCFLGQGFQDWLPRLHLFLSSRSNRPAGQVERENADDVPHDQADEEDATTAGVEPSESFLKPGQPERPMKAEGDGADSEHFGHIAVDRAFHWPELALLRAVDVEHVELDLTQLTLYPDPTIDDLDERVRGFLEEVAETARVRPR